MNKAKLIAIVVLVILAVVIVFQNTEPVSTKLLFVEVTMPHAVGFFVTTALGFALGMLTALVGRTKGKKAAHSSG